MTGTPVGVTSENRLLDSSRGPPSLLWLLSRACRRFWLLALRPPQASSLRLRCHAEHHRRSFRHPCQTHHILLPVRPHPAFDLLTLLAPAGLPGLPGLPGPLLSEPQGPCPAFPRRARTSCAVSGVPSQLQAVVTSELVMTRLRALPRRSSVPTSLSTTPKPLRSPKRKIESFPLRSAAFRSTVSQNRHCYSVPKMQATSM